MSKHQACAMMATVIASGWRDHPPDPHPHVQRCGRKQTSVQNASWSSKRQDYKSTKGKRSSPCGNPGCLGAYVSPWMLLVFGSRTLIARLCYSWIKYSNVPSSMLKINTGPNDNRGELAIASVKKKSASPTYPTGHQCTAFGSACFHHGLTFIFSSEFESNWQVC